MMLAHELEAGNCRNGADLSPNIRAGRAGWASGLLGVSTGACVTAAIDLLLVI